MGNGTQLSSMVIIFSCSSRKDSSLLDDDPLTDELSRILLLPPFDELHGEDLHISGPAEVFIMSLLKCLSDVIICVLGRQLDWV